MNNRLEHRERPRNHVECKFIENYQDKELTSRRLYFDSNPKYFFIFEELLDLPSRTYFTDA